MDTKIRSVPWSGPLKSVTGRSLDVPFQFDRAYNETNVPVFKEHQLIESEGHEISLLGKNGNRRDIGGPFLSKKIEVGITNAGGDTIGEFSVPEGYSGWSDTDGQNAFYAEGIVVHSSVNGLATTVQTANQIDSWCPLVASDFDLDGLGATAISICAPRNPVADAASTIGELKDGLPHIPKPTGNIGSEYLNIVFGAQPLASELTAYRNSWAKAEELLAQLERDAGKLVRRGFTFDPVITTSESSYGTNPVLLGGMVPYPQVIHSGWCNERSITETRTWFSGAFTYHLPKSGWRRTMNELDYLYGVKPGIDTLWELTPWSWLVDWQTNIGDVLHNVNAFSSDGLVMPYGYIMQTVKRDIFYDTRYQAVVDGNHEETRRFLNRVTITVKKRRPATPFGFGFDLGGLTLRQGAILAALGISKA